MVLFKINGERNSGTNFIHKILQINKFNVISHVKINKKKKLNRVKFWKHGVPKYNKQLDDRVIDIFIFRNLDDWLVSMFKNPYHLEKKKNFRKFLKQPQRVSLDNEIDPETNLFVNHDDQGKTIFKIRYFKFNAIKKYKNKNKDVIFVNLSYIQNPENLKLFLDKLNKTYLNKNSEKYITEIPHTKNKNKIKNRDYNIEISKYKNLINRKKNNYIERFINDLTYTIY